MNITAKQYHSPQANKTAQLPYEKLGKKCFLFWTCYARSAPGSARRRRISGDKTLTRVFFLCYTKPNSTNGGGAMLEFSKMINEQF